VTVACLRGRVTVVALAIAACSNKVEPKIEILRKLTHQMCACKDRQCAVNAIDAAADQVHSSFDPVSGATFAVTLHDDHPSDEQNAELTSLWDKYSGCRDKLAWTLVLAAANQARDAMCACKTRACTHPSHYTIGITTGNFLVAAPTAEQQQTLASIDGEIQQCREAVFVKTPN
jgi:hypothetical protein